jgi:ribosomal protein L11 methyltransferase
MKRVSRLAIRVRGDEAERALAALLPLMQAGAEERAAGDDVEYVLYAPSGELPRVIDVEQMLGDMLVDCTLEPVEPGWERHWHEFIRPVTVTAGGRSLTVRPPWLEGDPDDLVVDPDLFFGAGSHATTQLALRLLLSEPEPGGPLCDWGAGCGVLSVAAARLGWDPVTAVEVDPGALEVIRANAAANGVRVTTRWLNLGATPAPWAPTVCANLPSELLRVLPEVIERPPERFLVAGMITEEADAVIGELAAMGLREEHRLVDGEWTAARLVLADRSAGAAG